MKLDMVGVIVRDMEKAIRFYQQLGFNVSVGNKKEPYVELDHEGVRISLNKIELIEDVYGFKPEKSGDKVELAFLMESPAEIDALIEKMKAAGDYIVREPWQAPWGQYYAILKDEDENMLSLFCNL